MTLPAITPDEARQLVARGARLIDIRSPDEHARASIPGAENRPVERLDRVGDAPAVVYHCRSGMRTLANAARLAAASECPAYLLEGGLDAWRAAGLPVAENRKAPLEILRQVQITAGVLDGPRSIIFDQAENRLHMQKALMARLIDRWRSQSAREAHALSLSTR